MFNTLGALSRGLACLALCCSVFGCASLSSSEQGERTDPLEPLNRAVFDINIRLDDALIRPLAEAYRTFLPQWLRDRFRAFIDNLAEPRILANDLLQRRPDAAGKTFARFFINTIVGLGGMFDLATEQGFPKQSGDFGQTLYTLGVGDGPYVVLLFFGPSNVRDTVGLGVDLYTTPPALITSGDTGNAIQLAVGAVDGIDLRSRNIETLDEIKASSLDFYAHLRSIMRQRRAAQLREAGGGKEEPQELFDPGATPVAPR